MIAPIAIGVFVFVALAVAGWRALDTLDATKARKEADRRAAIRTRALRRDYSGPRYTVHGREIE